MSYGYSARIVTANKKASIRSFGVRLGRACIKQDVPVFFVADKLGVSRQTIYNWFCGVTLPHKDAIPRIKKYLASITNK